MIPENFKVGSNIGDAVYLINDAANQYPGCYGVIESIEPAQAYFLNAVYFIEIYEQSGRFREIIRSEWREFITDNLNHI